MPQQALRFSVRNQEGKRASTWKLWTQKSNEKHDVYLTCRSLGGALKASLHQSGSWHIGFLRDFLKKNLEDGQPQREGPYIDRWPRPKEIGPGVTLAYRIVVPMSGVNILITDKLPKSINWIPSAPKDKAIEIAVVFTQPNTTTTKWPGYKSMQTQLVGTLHLKNEENVWVVYRIIDTPPIKFPSCGKTSWFKSESEVNLSDGNIRAIIFGIDDGGSRYMIDCSVKVGSEQLTINCI